MYDLKEGSQVLGIRPFQTQPPLVALPQSLSLLLPRFAGRTLTSGSLVLLTLDARPTGTAQLTVNSEKMVIGTMLVKDVIQALTQ